MSAIHTVQGDARHISLADESVQCVVTSPPYWGLRKYAGIQDLIWGGATCEHEWAEETQRVKMRQGAGLEELSKKYRGGGHSQAALAVPYTVQRGTCIFCGAWRGAYGLEPTIEMYVAHTVEILREIRRVLRPDGVVFWNVGDSYAGGGNYRGITSEATLSSKQGSNRGARGVHQELGATREKLTGGLKCKDLCLIPSRVALAAQADGWWVRSMIVWAKPNPMPESVRDRPTDSYENVIMLTKSPKYYWDAAAVREENSAGSLKRYKDGDPIPTRNKLGGSARSNPSFLKGQVFKATGRNMRNVWTFATQSYKGAHFATFPEELPRRCIKAATKPGDLVLDPFAGSGTTGAVAKELGRDAYLLDLAYQELAADRIAKGTRLERKTNGKRD